MWLVNNKKSREHIHSTETGCFTVPRPCLLLREELDQGKVMAYSVKTIKKHQWSDRRS